MILVPVWCPFAEGIPSGVFIFFSRSGATSSTFAEFIKGFESCYTQILGLNHRFILDENPKVIK